jgi:sugar phosphate isomerase/epimerase
MRPAGFSTGALALSDFRRALDLMKSTDADAVELSALRKSELKPLIAALDDLDLKRFRHVSVHAPSQFSAKEEPEILDELRRAAEFGYYIVVHPDTLHDLKAWSTLGPRLCIENMDKRKSFGRSADELALLFESLPEAGLCFDIAHARQFDSSMTEAYRILLRFADRLVQVHFSEVSTLSRHTRASSTAAADFQQVASLIPDNAPVIVESQVSPSELASELAASRSALA